MHSEAAVHARTRSARSPALETHRKVSALQMGYERPSLLVTTGKNREKTLLRCGRFLYTHPLAMSATAGGTPYAACDLCPLVDCHCASVALYMGSESHRCLSQPEKITAIFAADSDRNRCRKGFRNPRSMGELDLPALWRSKCPTKENEKYRFSSP